MKDCSHAVDGVSMLAWHSGFREGDRKLRCAVCHATIAHTYRGVYQSLGESNDEPEAVKLEIRAAELAAMPLVSLEEWPARATSAEAIGWLLNKHDDDPICPSGGTWAGWLAFEIVSHDASAKDAP